MTNILASPRLCAARICLISSVCSAAFRTPCTRWTIAGATFAVAVQIAEKAPQGSVILAMLPDTGERYLTTPMFDGIAEDMNDEEKEISKSTPNYQMPAA